MPAGIARRTLYSHNLDMAEADRHLWEYRWFRDLGLLLGLVVVVWFLYTVQAIAVPVLIGFALAYAVNPVATWARRRLRIPRLLTALLLLILGMVILGLVLFFFLPSLVSQAQLLAGSLGKYVSWVANWGRDRWDEFLHQAAAMVGPGSEASSSAVASATEPASPAGGAMDLTTVGALLGRWLGVGVGVVGTALGMGSYLALALAIIVFCFIVFVWHFQRIIDWFAQFIPVPNRERAFYVTRRIDRALSGFIRGRLIQAAIITVNLAIGWRLAGVPFWLLLAAVAGVLNLIPYAAIFGFLLAVGLTVVDRLMMGGAAGTTGFPWEAVIWPTVAYVLAQLVDGWVVEPLVQGKATDLNSLTILLAVITGASVAGLLGMILAIPVTACLKILAEELLLPRLRAYAQAVPPPTVR